MGDIAPGRLYAALLLALPVLAGLAWLALAGAPSHYLLVNAAALAIGSAWIALGRAPSGRTASAALMAALVLVFALPLLTGPQIEGVQRWLPLGPVTLHSGMLTLPALSALATRDVRLGAIAVLLALIVAALQPDPASALAIACAAGAACLGLRQPLLALPAAAGGLVALVTAPRSDLVPQRFVEGVVQDAMASNLFAGAALLLVLLGTIALIGILAPLERAAPLALAGALTGFTVAALAGHYPAPLIGYGASSILGLALALGLARAPQPR